jgi:hypothetical protein
MIIVLDKKQEEIDAENRTFEMQLMIHRPEAYKEYKEKQEAELFRAQQAEIKWAVPGSVGELREVLGMIEQTNELFSQETDFTGVDLDQLGDDDG